jgi:hypothetical protein
LSLTCLSMVAVVAVSLAGRSAPTPAEMVLYSFLGGRDGAKRTKLSLLRSRQYSFEKRFLNINPQSTPRSGLSGLFPKAYKRRLHAPTLGGFVET